MAAEPPRPYAVPLPRSFPFCSARPSLSRRPRFWAVHLLIGLNVAYFLAMVIRGVDMIHPSTVDLLRWGADLGLLTLSGQWWRVLTAMFVHVGAVHLLMNMLSLWIIGRWVELWLGGRWMLFVYMVTGLFAGLASSRWQYDVPSAGASGAVLGLFGVFWGMVLRGRWGCRRR